MTNTKIETKEIRAELSNEFTYEGFYLYVRNLGEKGGVIDAIVSNRKAKKVSDILAKVQDKTFSTIWQELINAKVQKITYKAN